MQEDGIVFDEIAGVNMIEYYVKIREWLFSTLVFSVTTEEKYADIKFMEPIYYFCVDFILAGCIIHILRLVFVFFPLPQYLYWEVLKKNQNEPFWSGLK